MLVVLAGGFARQKGMAVEAAEVTPPRAACPKKITVPHLALGVVGDLGSL